MTRERVRELLEQGRSITDIARALGISKSTVCYHARRLGHAAEPRFALRYDWASIRRYYEEGHSARECRERFGFSSSAWWDAVHRGDVVPRSPLREVLLQLRYQHLVSRGSLKRGLLEAGLKASECERCGIRDWRGRPLTLALHHVNGDGQDNRLNNLQVLCPNCHSQTPTFSGRNVRRRRAARALVRAGAVLGAEIRRIPVLGEAA